MPAIAKEQITAAAAKGLMHWSECVTEGSDMDREFFATREEAEKSASDKTGFDEASEAEWTYEVRSMWLDEDGDLVCEEWENEKEDEA